MRIIAAADSQAVPVSSFKIYLTRVASLDTRGGGQAQLAWKVSGRGSVTGQRVADSTPLFAEMAAPGTSFAGRWEERKFLENQETSRALGWRSVPTPDSILSAANQFATAQLELHSRYAELTGLQGLAKSVQRLKEELHFAQAQPLTCLLCLGWGSGFISKSGFLDTDQDAIRKILKAVPAIGRSMRDGVPFPKTRRIVFSGGQPSTVPGWARLQFQQ